MEEFTGVNVEEVAAPQETQEEIQVQDTSGTTSEVADPKPVQDSQTNAAFAEMRRKAEDAEKRAAQVERDYSISRKYGAEYGVFSEKEIAERYASQGIRTLEQFEQALERQKYVDAGLNPDLLNQFINDHPDVKAARELRREKALFEQDKTLEADPKTGELYKQHKKEVQELANKLNTDYDIAWTMFVRNNLPDLITGTRQTAEQETIRKLQQNQTTSTGALGAGDPNHKTSISSLGKGDFNNIVQQVLRGERKTL